jgi:hypothetical protein
VAETVATMIDRDRVMLNMPAGAAGMRR